MVGAPWRARACAVAAVSLGAIAVAWMTTPEPAAADDELFFDLVGRDIEGAGAYARFGSSVDLSTDGTRMVINGTGTGTFEEVATRASHTVRVVEWNAAAWTTVGKNIRIESNSEQNESSVAISDDGTRVVISDPLNTSNGVLQSGRVQAYDWDGTDWVPTGSPIDGVSFNQLFGISIALSADGSRLAVGASEDKEPGSASVFEWNGTDWSQLGSAIVGEDGLVDAGRAVALSADGGRLALGGEVVRVFDWSGTAWTQVGDDITAGNASWRQRFGWDVTMSADGQRLGVAARGDHIVFGVASVFDLIGGSWTAIDETVGPTVRSVRLSGDGSRLVYAHWPVTEASSPVRDLPPVGAVGRVTVRDEGPAGWFDSGTTAAESADQLVDGVALSSNGGRVALGSSSNDGAGTESGHVRVFDLTSTPPAPDDDVVAVSPARLLDTRPGGETVDGLNEPIGGRSERTTLIEVAGRAGVPDDALGVMLNVTAVNPEAAGYLSACSSPTTGASILNHGERETIAAGAFVRLTLDGYACVYTSVETDLVVDVTGYTPARSGLWSVSPARMLDTRTGEITTGIEDTIGDVERIEADAVVEFFVGSYASRGGVPLGSTGVMLSVAAVNPEADGFLTVFSCDDERPTGRRSTSLRGRRSRTRRSSTSAASVVCASTRR